MKLQQTKQKINPIIHTIDNVLEFMLFISLAIMSAIVFYNVVRRYLFGSALSWGDEMAQILMVWLTFLGAAVAMRDREHFAFDYLVKNMKATGKKVVILSSHIISISITIALIYWSGKVTWEIKDWVMPASTWLSRSFVYGACPVGCSFLLMYAVRNFIKDLKAKEVEVIHQEEEL